MHPSCHYQGWNHHCSEQSVLMTQHQKCSSLLIPSTPGSSVLPRPLACRDKAAPQPRPAAKVQRGHAADTRECLGSCLQMGSVRDNAGRDNKRPKDRALRVLARSCQAAFLPQNTAETWMGELSPTPGISSMQPAGDTSRVVCSVWRSVSLPEPFPAIRKAISQRCPAPLTQRLAGVPQP